MPGQHAFPRQERLTRKREFLAAYEHGVKCVGRGFVCYVARQDTPGRQIGFTVSRKVGGAVVRNRVKRYLREIMRTYRPDLPDNVHIVFVARHAAAEYDFQQCQRAVRELLMREGIVCD